MDFGLHAGPQNCTFDELRHLWARADESGFHWISVWDHFYPAHTEAEGDCFEAVASHAALAALTRNVRVGCLVYCVAYRNPAILANVAVTLDHIPGGRAELGIGAGWSEAEFRAYGIPFERPGIRLRQLEEAAIVIRGLLTQDRATFHGSTVNVTDAYCNPKMRQASPRLWIGAWGERAMGVVARQADGWNAAFLSPETWGGRNRLLSELVEQEGRDLAAIRRSVNVGLALVETEAVAAAKRFRLGEQFGPLADHVAQRSLLNTPQQMIDRVKTYQKAETDMVVVALRSPFDLKSFELFARDVLPTFA